MYVKQPKKLLILNILDILRKYSDEDHRLSQREIGEILKTEYGMTADRKAIRRNLSELLECGYPIEYSETLRSAPVKGPDGREKLGPDGKPLREETTILSDFYLERQFTDGELRLLIDGLLFSRHVPYLPWAHGRSLDLAAYMREHPYMYSSENVRTKLKIVPTMVSDVIDMFGKEVRLEKEGDAVAVTLTANEMALKQFAKNFAPDVVVLEPQTLRDQVREELERGAAAYRL